jgi:hypothetical protein
VESGGVLILVEDVAEPCRLAIERGEEEEDDTPSLFSASDEAVSWAGLGLVDVVAVGLHVGCGGLLLLVR